MAGLIQFVMIIFLLLIVVLLAIMVFVEFNIHLFFLTALSVAVFASLMWFVSNSSLLCRNSSFRFVSELQLEQKKAKQTASTETDKTK